ncbi:hypothetical protein [Dyella terrae]|uniref:hypothetical protein n=1 Tax=Dyella terrae TaxID=522259 RepID=UPI001EFD4C5E|nr:hypothetical protein [Dyella terrae]ULU24588.1 hypothetical protein DYST_01506 [Dyella terrae]
MSVFISPPPDDLSTYNSFIGGYRTHVDQQVFIDRQDDGYGMWMYEEDEDIWQDHIEVYMPMTVEAVRAYFAPSTGMCDAIGLGSYSDEGNSFIAIIRAQPGVALACGDVVPPGGIFAMNGELFVPLTVDRSVGAHYLLFAND